MSALRTLDYRLVERSDGRYVVVNLRTGTTTSRDYPLDVARRIMTEAQRQDDAYRAGRSA